MDESSQRRRADAATGPGGVWAGAAVTDLTPPGSVFLYGYPHVPRMSTGVHDVLECAALYLRSGETAALLLANDLIFVTKELTAAVRERVVAATGMPAHAIMVTATHTHSGPVVANYLSNAADPVVPAADRALLEWMAGRMAEAAIQAVRAAVPAEVGLGRARAEGVGTNRHDPTGPTDPDVPVLLVRSRAEHRALACLIVYGMHPTVLHEDSTLISADFPGFAREWLRNKVLPAKCPVLYLSGAAGNQSPRHVTRANTFEEAARLGGLLGQAVAAVVPTMAFHADVAILCRQSFLPVARRDLPAEAEARQAVAQAKARCAALRDAGAPRPAVRTAECDVFGAEETAELARAAADGRLDRAVAPCLPAEIQLVEVGPWKFIAWPGEFFVEYALEVKRRAPDTFIVTLANGELQGYVVTPEAAAGRVYESTNAVFAPENGARFVDATLALLGPRRSD